MLSSRATCCYACWVATEYALGGHQPGLVQDLEAPTSGKRERFSRGSSGTERANRSLAGAVQRKQTLIEHFKSDNALLRKL
jgi:hypothetical protein